MGRACLPFSGLLLLLRTYNHNLPENQNTDKRKENNILTESDRKVYFTKREKQCFVGDDDI
jgi:hypothetical protein